MTPFRFCWIYDYIGSTTDSVFKRIPWKTTWRNRLPTTDLAGAVFIGMGTNIGTPGQRRRILLLALHEIESTGIGRVLAVSSLYETPPWGKLDQDLFTNGVFAIQTALEPLGLLRRLKWIERRLGRKPRMRWGPREIDLDILIFKHRKIDLPGLTIPHKYMKEREFVMEPLREVISVSI